MDYKIVIAIFTWLTLNAVECVEIERNCTKNDTHCLQKREEMHWCTDQGCSTCTDHNCVMTCQGFSCGICPKGDCCNGTNCNACHNGSCCTTVACNYCIRTCKQACENSTLCERICTPQCENSGRTVFVIPSISNGNQATVYIKGVPYKGDVTSRPFSTLDRTAIVLIDGIDHIAIVLSLPHHNTCKEKECGSNCTGSHCDCMRKCQSKCSKDCRGSCQKQCSETASEKEFNYYYTLTPGCCHLVHPQICNSVPPFGQTYCYKKSNRECSTLCTSKFIHIGPHRQNFVQHYHCYYIQAYPYVYCGNYVIQNCDSCYVCKGNYNPSECVKSSLCPNTCRKNFLPFKSVGERQKTPSFQPSVQNYLPNQYMRPLGYPYSFPNQPFPGFHQFG